MTRTEKNESFKNYESTSDGEKSDALQIIMACELYILKVNNYRFQEKTLIFCVKRKSLKRNVTYIYTPTLNHQKGHQIWTFEIFKSF